MVNIDGQNGIVVYPNPVRHNQFVVEFKNKPAGEYNIQLVNILGQVVYTKVVLHPGGNSTYTVRPATLIAKGIYDLKVVGETIKTTERIIFE